MGSGSGGVTVGYRYYLSIFFGLSRGPIDELIQIKVGDTNAWNGEINQTAASSIDQPNLFGGDAREGGIQGGFSLFMGDATQVFPADLAAQIGGYVPGFRGICSLFYRGLVCSNNPYPKTWKFRLRRWEKGWDGDPWYPEKAAIVMYTNDYVLSEDIYVGQIVGMNPAHIIYECSTNRDWGRGLDRNLMDDDSFTQAANQLCAEGFGLCVVWDRRSDISDFIQGIIDTIGAVVYINRATGLYSIKLLRDDYDVGSVPIVDYNSGLLEITNANTATPQTGYNEVIVQYHNPVRDEDKAVRVQNLASIQQNGSKLSITKSYTGVATPQLALQLAQRDLRILGSGLKQYTLKLDRRGYGLTPGMVVRLVAADKGIDMIVRMINTGDSTLSDGKMTFSAIEDVFGLPYSTYTGVVDLAWIAPDTSAVAISDQFLEDATYRELYRQLGATDAQAYDPDSSVIVYQAKKPTSLAQGYELYTVASGETAFGDRGAKSFVQTMKLAAAIGLYDTAITINSADFVDGQFVTPSVWQIGEELIRLDYLNLTTGVATIARGCVDTLPAVHAVATLITCRDNAANDDREYVNGETVGVRGLTKTSSQLLLIGAATQVNFTFPAAARHQRPYPPAGLKLNGDYWGLSSFVAGGTALSGDLTLTWQGRQRIYQADTIIGYDYGNIGPEDGSTFHFRVYKDANTPIDYTSTTNTFVYTEAQRETDNLPASFRVQFWVEVGGIQCYQIYDFYVNQTLPASGTGTGWGSSWGNNWGN